MKKILLPRRRPFRRPRLVFAPLAWMKLQYFCHAGDTEIGGFGITAETNLLYIEDFVTVRQRVSPVTVAFVDDAVADLFDRCVDAGLRPAQFSRIWCHTHPADSVMPSGTDEETFARVFGRSDWALMFILGRTGKTYARLRFAAGPGGQTELRATVDWPAWPAVADRQRDEFLKDLAEWEHEYAANVEILPQLPGQPFFLARERSVHSNAAPTQICRDPHFQDWLIPEKTDNGSGSSPHL